MKRSKLRALLGILAVVLVLTIPTEYYVVEEAQAATAGTTLTPLQEGFMTHIDHIIFVVMENHAYDSDFGVYCQVTSTICPHTSLGVPAGICIPTNPAKPANGCIRPFNLTKETISDMGHDATNSISAWNNGSMNNFYLAEGRAGNTFGHYNGTTVPTYWDLAEEYTLSDHFFSSVLSYSLPNHWHIVAGQAPAISIDYAPVPGTTPPIPPLQVVSKDHTYLNQSNQTRSVEDLLNRSSVSWKYYDYTLGSYASSIKIVLNANGTKVTSLGGAYSYWNPQAAKAESYTSAFVSHFVPNTQFYRDARNGTLPSISWVIPPGQDSDHPGVNTTVAQDYVASLVDALESSPEWNSSVMFITWDDYGGFYDNVAPPTVGGQQLGFRVPLLTISPYSQKGWIATKQTYFESVLRLMEWRFNLGCVAALDCNAPLPIGGFNFTKTPRAPILFPTNFSLSRYPYNPNWNGSASVPIGSYSPPSEFTYFPDGEAPDID